MNTNAPPTIVPREVIEIDSDTDSDTFNRSNPFAAFFDLETIDQAFPDIPDYPSHENGDVEQTALPLRTATEAASEAAYQPVLITNPEVLYQLYLDKVLEVFPDVCRDYLRTLYDGQAAAFPVERSQLVNEELSQAVIVQILDAEKYPTEKEKKKKLKRKRAEGSDSEEEEKNYTRLSRPRITAAEIQDARLLLLWEFASVPLTFIDLQLKTCGNLYPAYLAIEYADRTYDQAPLPPYRKLQKLRKIKHTERDFMSSTEPTGYSTEALRKELQAAKRKRQKEADKLKREQMIAEADAALEKTCIENGEMVECQCCFSDVPIPKSTQCNNFHFFCLDCAQRNAKSQVELSRYEIKCIDSSGCKAEFTMAEKHRFLDAKLLEVLDRLQQQSELRTAGLENLESCPFCDYAAIYPPVAENKEFRCRMPDCERVSCRLCKADSHLPLTCLEYKKEQGVSERHVLEEAMTNAIIRTCPKCGVPIFKDGGCNKMVCTKCRTYVCDYCGKDISKESYGHFDNGTGSNPSGKRKCPTQDNTIARNAERIAEAEREAMAKVRAENPELSEEDLKIKFSAEVSNDGNSAAVVPPFYAGMPYLPPVNPPAQLRAQMRLREVQLRRIQQVANTNLTVRPANEAAHAVAVQRPINNRLMDLDPIFRPEFDLLAQPPNQPLNHRLPQNPYHFPELAAVPTTAAHRQARRPHTEAQWNNPGVQDEFEEFINLETPEFGTPQLNRYGAAAGAAPIEFDPLRPYNDFGMVNEATNGYGYLPAPAAEPYAGNFGQPYTGWLDPMMMAPPLAQNQTTPEDPGFLPRIPRRY
ncbi:hypothetical protein MMC26_002253 [Xylographa opegraphella]|nr:hypothetical protein [Xylographa opegraphella]